MNNYALCTTSHRRLAARPRQAGVGSKVESDRRGGEGGAAPAGARLTGSATGLLIARLDPGIPTVYSTHVECIPSIVAGLVERGYLKPEDTAESAEHLVQRGIEHMTSPGLDAYENSWGEVVHIGMDKEGFGLSVYQDCHGWRMRIKPILAALTAERGRQFIADLNQSCVQGPCFWDRVAGYSLIGDVEDEEPHPDDPTPAAESGSEWLKKLYAETPALGGKDRRLVSLYTEEKPSDPALVALIERFIAADSEARCYQGDGALMCTTWDKTCPIEHAHDFIEDGIHNGGWDNQDGEAFGGRFETLDELERAFVIIGNCIAAATAIEEWSNQQCQL